MARHLAKALVLGLGLIAAMSAPAQDLVFPDRARLQAMSQEEYAAYRDQIQNRLEGMNAAERDLMRDSGIDGRSRTENRHAAGGYGQGYGSRGRQGVGFGRGGGRGR